MEKIIYAFILFIMVSLTMIIPVSAIFYGVKIILSHTSFFTGAGLVAFGLVILWLIKPISIITNKDHKIF